MSDVYPVLPMLIAAAICPFAGRMGRRVLSVLGPLVAGYLVLTIPDGAAYAIDVVGIHLKLWQMDALSRVFALAFTLYGVFAGIYAWSEQGTGRKIASLFQVIGGTGVVLAGDLWSLLLFWEMLTISSLVLIWFGGFKQSYAAGFRYLYIHLAGGLCLLAGAIMLGGELTAINLAGPASWLLLIGLLVNAAVPPLHAWLPDAYPRASVFGTVYLAAFTTKGAVYVLARMFPDTGVLIWLGTIMALYGVIFAVLENDIRRLLGYHIVSQVGYMVAGVGMAVIGTKAGDMALNGAAAHAFSHIFYKGLLMMSAGAVLYATSCRKLTELGGLGKSMWLTFVFCMIGGVSISGVPGFNGFISKSMVISAAKYQHLADIEILLVIASMGTFLHTGLKLPYFTFLDKPKKAKVERQLPISMYLGMGLAAAVCTITGLPAHIGHFHNPLSYDLLYQFLPYQQFQPVYHPYSWGHFIGTLELLVATAMAFWMIHHKLGGQPTITLDVDRLYRKPTAMIVEAVGRTAQGLGGYVEAITAGAIDIAWAGVNTIGNLRRGVALAQQIAVILFILAAVAYIALFLLG